MTFRVGDLIKMKNYTNRYYVYRVLVVNSNDTVDIMSEYEVVGNINRQCGQYHYSNQATRLFELVFVKPSKKERKGFSKFAYEKYPIEACRSS